MVEKVGGVSVEDADALLEDTTLNLDNFIDKEIENHAQTVAYVGRAIRDESRRFNLGNEPETFGLHSKRSQRR